MPTGGKKKTFIHVWGFWFSNDSLAFDPEVF